MAVHGTQPTLTAVSLFAGIGGIDLALTRAGVRVVAAVEIDPAARSVLARHFPDVKLFNDVTEVSGDELTAAGFVPRRGILAGGFPCFAAGTRILCERGWVAIEDVRVGDLVLTHRGRWCPVTSVMSRLSDHAVRLRGHGIPPVTTTDEHPFYARARTTVWVPRSADRPRGTNRRSFGEPGWVPAAKMADQFAAQVLPPVEPSYQPPDLWWVVGRYLADGWTTTSGHRSGRERPRRAVICCAHGEADDLAGRLERVVPATRSEGRTTTKFVITQRWFVQMVSPLGRGAHAKTLTRRELSLDAERAEALLAGWLSGDGSRPARTRIWKGTTVSRSLALSMALLAQRARGVVAAVHETAMPETTVIEGRTVRQRAQYQVVIPDRNRSAFVEDAYGWKLVRSAVRADGPVRVYNLSVAEDESYVADGAVVHNCQDLSVAGRRAGLGGARSGLFWQVMRLADELSPRWLLLENVPGLLSAVCQCPGDGTCVANGRAVRCGEWHNQRAGTGEAAAQGECPRCGCSRELHDLGGFCAGCRATCDDEPGSVTLVRVFVPDIPHTPPKGACEYGCMRQHGGAMGSVLGAMGERGYGFAYRVLDAQHFGVPQRRRRVFIAGCLGDRAAPVEVLLEPEGGAGHPAARIPARPGTAGGASGVTGGSGAVATLQGGGRRGHRVDAEGAAGGHLIASALTARQGKVPDSDATSGFIAYPLLGVNGRTGDADVRASAGTGIGRGNDPMFTLQAGKKHGVAIPLAIRGREGGAQLEVGQPGECAFTVRTPGGGSSHPMIAHALTSEGADASEDGTGRGTPLVTVPIAAPLTHGSATGEGVNAPGRRREDDVNLVAMPIQDSRDIAKSQNGLGVGEGPPAYTVDTTGAAAVAMAFNWQTGADGRVGYGDKPTALHAGQTPAVAISENQRGELRETSYSRSVTSGEGKPGQGYPAVRTGMAVRRLSPLEAERLQGFPDNWTKWDADGAEQSDSARYRQCGNAVAVPVVEWIARRIAAVDEASQPG